MAAVDELSQLKRLILGQEQQSLERLQQRVELTGTRAQDVAEVLAESFELNQDDNGRLQAAMRAPVQQCITSTIQEDPQEFADALFPVIGPAIRRAVSESISALSEKINRALERSFSIQGIKWRIESARTGVPVSQIVLRDTFIYRVEQAFVIQRDSGLLVSHVSRDDIHEQDSDAVSAMFSALGDFVRDSFSDGAGDDSELDTIRVGEQVVWVFHGPEFIIAALIAGQPPREMRTIFQEVTESIHQEFGAALKAFDGDGASASELSAGVQVLLQPLLESEIQRSNFSKSSANDKRPLFGLALILVVLFAAWLIYRYVENSRLDELTSKIKQTPGVELISISADRPMQLRAFRDPLAADISAMLEGTAFTEEDIEAEFVPFQSLESEIVVQRLATLFSPPTTLKMTVENGTLHVSGQAPAGYGNRLTGFPLTVFGIDKIDLSNLNADNTQALNRLRVELEVPSSVTMKFNNGTVITEGLAPYEWILRARAHRSEIPEIKNIELNNVTARPASLRSYLLAHSNASELVELTISGRQASLEGGGSLAWLSKFEQIAKQTGLIDSIDARRFVPIEVEELKALASHISNQKFYFSRSDQLAKISLEQLERLKPDLARLVDIEQMLPDTTLAFSIRGFADSAGSPEQHDTVRAKRVSRMKNYLLNNGISEQQIVLISGQTEIADDESRQWRRAEVEVELTRVER